MGSCSLTPEEEEILIQKKAADVLLLTSLTNSDAFIERPSVPKCQGGCEGELGVAQYASGVNYPHGEWICDSCEESSTGPRWTCTEECEYDLCCDCAKVSFIEIHRWEKRIQLLEKLVTEPKRFWLNPRSDSSLTTREREQMKLLSVTAAGGGAGGAGVGAGAGAVSGAGVAGASSALVPSASRSDLSTLSSSSSASSS